MTARRDNDDLIRYLEDGPNELPSFSYDAVRSTIDHKRQRVVIGPWRVPNMNTYAKYGIAAVVVAVVAVLGFNYLPRSGGVGGSGATPTVPATYTAPSPTTSPTPSPQEAVELPVGADIAIAPGIYYTEDVAGGDTFRVTFTVPSGWTADEGWSLYKDRGEPGEVMFTTYIVTHIFPDACHWEAMTQSLVEIGSASELILELTHQAPREETAGSWPWSGVIGGLPAEGVELEVSPDFDTSDCTNGNLRYWPDPGPNFSGGLCCNAPGNTDFVYAVDVNGSTMAVIARHYAGSTAQDREELQSILDSLRIEP